MIIITHAHLNLLRSQLWKRVGESDDLKRAISRPSLEVNRLDRIRSQSDPLHLETSGWKLLTPNPYGTHLLAFSTGLESNPGVIHSPASWYLRLHNPIQSLKSSRAGGDFKGSE